MCAESIRWYNIDELTQIGKYQYINRDPLYSFTINLFKYRKPPVNKKKTERVKD